MKYLKIIALFLLITACSLTAEAHFLAGQGYNFATMSVTGSDGSSSLYTQYSGLEFKLIAWQSEDNGPTDNTIEYLIFIDRGSIEDGDLTLVCPSTSYTFINTGLGVTTSATCVSTIYGEKEIISHSSNGMLSSSTSNGPVSIELEYNLQFVDGSTMELSATVILGIK